MTSNPNRLAGVIVYGVFALVALVGAMVAHWAMK
jgi:hypothetical protein